MYGQLFCENLKFNDKNLTLQQLTTYLSDSFFSIIYFTYILLRHLQTFTHFKCNEKLWKIKETYGKFHFPKCFNFLM